ncbi:menaquinone-dependent protoporphyrinogen IX dehydrogenase [Pseudomonadota bacterium]
MNKVVILYSTTDDHTVKISQRIKSMLENSGHDVMLVAVSSAGSLELSEFDKIIIGASIRYGKHKEEVGDFVSKNREILETKITAFFTVNVVARKPNKNTPDTNPYLKKFLSKVSWKPDELGVFAGKIDYQKYGVLDRMMIRLIMFMTKGPTNPTAVVEFTDWETVEKFGRVVGEL